MHWLSRMWLRNAVVKVKRRPTRESLPWGTETSQPTQSDKKEDLPLTKREKRLLGSLYADQEPDEDDEDAVLFEENSTSLTSSTGVDLPFSVLIGDAGEVFDVIGPFDEDRDLDDEYIEVW